jgi:hypothetical protein
MKHVKSAHAESLVTEAAAQLNQRRSVPTGRLLGLVLEQNLPFRFADSPRVRGLLGNSCSRDGLAHFADKMVERLQEGLAAQLGELDHLTLVMDEWSDANCRPFLGMKVHGCCGKPLRYRVLSLEHVPLEAKDADAICGRANSVLDRYGIRDRVEFVVTDTAAVMSSAVRKMERVWSPCWAHILNLMLGAMVEALVPDFLGSVLQMAGKLSRTWRWAKIMSHYEGYTVASIPTYSPTRWYSLAKLVHYTLKLRTPIEEFLGKDCPLTGSWEKVAAFERIVGTFANATACLESEEFGTLSRVYDWLFLIRKISVEVALEWPVMREAWLAAERYIHDNLGRPDGDQSVPGRPLGKGHFLNSRLLVATLLNPATVPSVVLSTANFRSAYALLNSAYESKLLEAPFGERFRIGPGGRTRGSGSPTRRASDSGLTLADLDVDSRMEIEPGNEVERYMALNRVEVRLEGERFDLLGWWDRHQASFPVLYSLALDYLCVPASSASIERQFSKAKLLQSDRRQSMTKERLAGMVLLREHLDLVDPLDAVPVGERPEADDVGSQENEEFPEQ